MRLHSLIYALTCSVPSIGLVYDPKVEGFLQYIGNRNVFHADSIDCDGLVECLDGIIENKDELVREIEQKRCELREKAMRNAYIAKEMLEGTEND